MFYIYNTYMFCILFVSIFFFFSQNTLLEWLHLLRLEEYYETLCDQGYDSVDKVTELTWEDLEEIGIQKLGTGLAFKK